MASKERQNFGENEKSTTQNSPNEIKQSFIAIVLL